MRKNIFASCDGNSSAMQRFIRICEIKCLRRLWPAIAFVSSLLTCSYSHPFTSLELRFAPDQSTESCQITTVPDLLQHYNSIQIYNNTTIVFSACAWQALLLGTVYISVDLHLHCLHIHVVPCTVWQHVANLGTHTYVLKFIFQFSIFVFYFMS